LGYADGREAARGIAEWIAFYCELRPPDRTSMAVWSAPIDGAISVDMIGNACALPTCPQWQPQTEPLAA
jgi:hypothetical protein